MKNVLAIAMLIGIVSSLFAQQNVIMEKRAKEMHRMMTISDREAWKKYVQENYTKAMISRVMKSRVEHAEPSSTQATVTEGKSEGNVEAKAAMFERLHNDFGNSKIISLKPTKENLEMIVENANGLKGVFMLKFETKDPYLIDALGIEVHDR
jgi:hypothetical protein